jgi:hypothetical protein
MQTGGTSLPQASTLPRASPSGEGPVRSSTVGTLAFRRRRGFAYLWLPVAWARRPGVEVVLSISRSHVVDSTRWKQVAHPSARTWMHHLEVYGVDDLDDEVRSWLHEAYAEAG